MSYIKHPLIKPETIEARLYQQMILDTAVRANTLVVLPTGLGKTPLSIMVAANRLAQFPDSKILMMAPTRPLVVQHFHTFRRMMNIELDKLRVLTGHTSPSERGELWRDVKLAFATPQVVERDLLANRFSLENFSLLIFDESHRATGNYPYRFIAERYMHTARTPLILALTASPGGKVEKIEEVKKNLFIRRVEARTDRDSDVLPYIQPVKIEWRRLKLPKPMIEIKTVLKRKFKEHLRILKGYGFLRSIQGVGKRELLQVQHGIREAMREQGPNPSPNYYNALVAQAVAFRLCHAMELLETQGLASLGHYLSRLSRKASKPGAPRSAKLLMSDSQIKRIVELVDDLQGKLENPKIVEARKILTKQFERNPDSRAIVFTHYRDSAESVVQALNSVGNVRAMKFIGQAKREGEKGLTQREQGKILDRFKEGEVNVLVSTSVHPDEFIILRDPSRKIRIEKIGKFVDSFIGGSVGRGLVSESRRINDWAVLSTDGRKVEFLPITAVHRHRRQSKTVKMRLSSGAETLITEDHSVFTFDESGRHVAVKPKPYLFVALANSVPNVEETTEIDVVRELIRNCPEKELNKLYCTFDGLNQAKIRTFSTDAKVLAALREGGRSVKALAGITNLDVTTITNVRKRLETLGFLASTKRGKYKFCNITVNGRKYLSFLEWFRGHVRYSKLKYRSSMKDVLSAPESTRMFCKTYVELRYGKTRVPRFINVTDALAEFLGFYVSEGCIRQGKKGSYIFLSAKDEGVRRRMKKSVEDGLSLKTEVGPRGVYIDSYLALLLTKYVFKCGVGAHNKEVPSLIFSAPRQQKWKFLEAYFLGDGYRDENRIVFTTVSRKLVAGLSFLLRQLDVRKISFHKQRVYRINVFEPLPFAKVRDSRGNCTYFTTMPHALTSAEASRKFDNEYVRTSEKLKSRIAVKPWGPIGFDYVKDISNLNPQPNFVYDISVKNTERFFGGIGPICLHNSVGEEGLDIPNVDLVLFYEAVPSGIRLIQRRGRTGRKRPGRVIALLAKGTRDEAFYWSAVHKERQTQEAISKAGGEAEKVGQKMLDEFSGEQIKIVADHREVPSGVIRELTHLGAKVETRQLKVGDFILSERVGIERKSTQDFLQSIVDKRLIDQAKQLAETFERPVLILEGEGLFTQRAIHPNAIRGALASLAVDYGIPILPTLDEKETARLLFAIARREQEGVAKEIPIRGVAKGLTLPEQQRFVVEGLPGVSAVLARRLLEHFGAVEKIMGASVDELREVHGIGKEKARRIRRVLSSKYEVE